MELKNTVVWLRVRSICSYSHRKRWSKSNVTSCCVVLLPPTGKKTYIPWERAYKNYLGQKYSTKFNVLCLTKRASGAKPKQIANAFILSHIQSHNDLPTIELPCQTSFHLHYLSTTTLLEDWKDNNNNIRRVWRTQQPSSLIPAWTTSVLKRSRISCSLISCRTTPGLLFDLTNLTLSWSGSTTIYIPPRSPEDPFNELTSSSLYRRQMAMISDPNSVKVHFWRRTVPYIHKCGAIHLFKGRNIISQNIMLYDCPRFLLSIHIYMRRIHVTCSPSLRGILGLSFFILDRHTVFDRRNKHNLMSRKWAVRVNLPSTRCPAYGYMILRST